MLSQFSCDSQSYNIAQKFFSFSVILHLKSEMSQSSCREMSSKELIREIKSKNNYQAPLLQEHFEIFKNKYFNTRLSSLSEVKDIISKKFARLDRISIICRAMEVHLRHKVRDVQIMAVLMMYDPQMCGRLSEIGTGEGKTIIIAMLAVLFGLEKRKVDIGM